MTLSIDLKAVFSGSYFNHRGEPCSVAHEVELPLILAARIRPPTKKAAHKLVLSTAGSNTALNLTDLFDDFILSNQDAGLDCSAILGASANTAMGLMLWGPEGDSPSTDETKKVTKKYKSILWP